MIFLGNYYSEHIFLLFLSSIFFSLGIFFNRISCFDKKGIAFICLGISSISGYGLFTVIERDNFNNYKKEYFRKIQLEENITDNEIIERYKNTNLDILLEKYRKVKQLEKIRNEIFHKK